MDFSHIGRDFARVAIVALILAVSLGGCCGGVATWLLMK